MVEAGLKVRYIHSDVDTLERIAIIRDLRLGVFDILVGINLLREGLDIPECALVAILDADKEGYLRSKTSLVQTIGRAARNVDGRVLLYADHMTESLEYAIGETNRRRKRQQEYNETHGITPESVKKQIGDILESVYERDRLTVDAGPAADHLVGMSLRHYISELETQLRHAAADLEVEPAAMLRDEIGRLEAYDLEMPADSVPINTEIAATIQGMPDALAPKAKKTYGAQRRGKKKGKRARRGPGRMV